MNYQRQFPLLTKKLVPAGTRLTEQVVADIAAMGRLQPSEECLLLEYATVRPDLQHFLAIPPYREIFSNKEIVAKLFADMQKVRLPLALFKLDCPRFNPSD